MSAFHPERPVRLRPIADIRLMSHLIAHFLNANCNRGHKPFMSTRANFISDAQEVLCEAC